MSAAETILSVATWLGLALLVAAFLLTVWRVVKGPTLPDRVVALDMLVGIVIGFIALIAIRTGFTLYIDIAIALGLVGFLATVAFARFILGSKARQTAPEGGTPVANAADVEAVGAAVRGVNKKSKAKSVRNSAGAEDKTAAKAASGSVPKRSSKEPVAGELSETMSAFVTPVEKPTAGTRGKSSGGSAKKPASKPQRKSVDKPASKSSSKSNSKTTEKPAGKATGKPPKPAKGQ